MEGKAGKCIHLYIYLYNLSVKRIFFTPAKIQGSLPAGKQPQVKKWAQTFPISLNTYLKERGKEMPTLTS